MLRFVWPILLLLVWGVPAHVLAQEGRKEVLITAPSALIDTGVFDYILPRFRLKTQITVTLVDGPADVQFLPSTGKPILQRGEVVYGIQTRVESPVATRFTDWLTSEVGRKTILAYAPNGAAVFQLPQAQTAEIKAREITGDAVLGLAQSRQKCARCHVVEKGGMNSIGSTPSFFLLRSFGDWDVRFGGFYTLNPHPAFTIIPDVTEPFDKTRPAPIVPIELTVQELEAIIAYVEGLPPADLGAPLRHQ